MCSSAIEEVGGIGLSIVTSRGYNFDGSGGGGSDSNICEIDSSLSSAGLSIDGSSGCDWKYFDFFIDICNNSIIIFAPLASYMIIGDISLIMGL